MSRAMFYGSLSALIISAFFLFFSCVNAPPNPYAPSNTKINLTLKSSSNQIAGDTLIDTVGNTISVGITANLPSSVDSIEITVYNSNGRVDVDTMLKQLLPLQNDGTLWYQITFATSGSRNIIGTVFAAENTKNPTSPYVIEILDRPVKPAARAWPHISVSGTKNITTSQTCSLAVSVLDSNPAQAHTFYVKQDTQPQSVFTPPMFKWTPPAGFTGTSTVVFKVTDTDSPSYFDTQTVVITVSATITTPKWAKDTVSLTGPQGSALSLTLTNICSGDSLSFSIAAEPALSGDTIISGVYTYTFAQGDTNTYWPKIIAKDKNGNADTMTLHLWATKPTASSAKALTAFSFATPAVTGTIIDSSKTVALTAPYGTDVTALVATFATTGASVKIGSVVQTSGTTANSFSSPVTYTVVAADGSTQAYVVTVTVAANNAKALTAFSFASLGVNGTITESAKTVALAVPYGTDVTALVATFASTGTSMKVGTTVQISATTANNFTSPVTYTVVAADGSTQNYVITVTIAANTAKALTAFSFAGLGVTGTITESTKTVALTVPYGTDVTALVATFTSTGASVKVGTVAQKSGTTGNDFTNPVTYTVVAADGSTQNYVVTVTVTPSNAKALTAFSFVSPADTGTITGTSIAVTVPNGTVVTGLIANFTSTGSSVKVGSVVQKSGTTANDFTSPVTYTVVAADGSTQNYAVTVTVTPSNAKALTAFSFVSPADTGTITGTSIAVTVPNGTTVTGLVANFTTNGASVKVGTVAQKSGTTANDFTNAVTYTIVAADGSTQNYVVTVTVAASTAITITTQPQSQAKCLGAPVSFSIAATTGSGSLSYQWKNAAGNLTEGHYVGTTTASLSIGAVTTNDTGAYSCVVSNTAGTKATSNEAKLTLNAATSITTQPSLQNTCLGASASFTVAATGSGALTYQWQKSGANISGATAATYTISSVASGDAANYTCVVTGGCGPVTSNAAALTINNATSITTQPSLQNTCLGASASFTVAATGSGALAYQWQKGGANISGATAATYTISSVASGDAANYTCVVTGGCGPVTSNAAALTINNATSITTQPSLQNTCLGASASFTVAATGSGALTYQWQKGGANISGATAATYTISSVASGDAANYTCVVTGGCGPVTSNAAALTINTAVLISTQPVPTTVTAGSPAIFTVVASGSGSLLYQWQRNEANISGTAAQNSSYTLSGTVVSDNGAKFRCIVTNSCGNVTSTEVLLTVNPPAPVAPTLIFPVKDTSDISLTPTLSWNSVATAQSYNVQVSNSLTFPANPIVNISGLTSTTASISSGLVNSTKYYWRVSATNAGGQGSWSATDSFITLITWTAENTNLNNSNIGSFAGISGNLFAATDGGVYRSTNNGGSWSNTGTSGLGNVSISKIAVNGANIVVADGYSELSYSTDNGAHWTSASISDLSIASLANNGSTFLAGTSDSGVFRSTNSGATWTRQNNANLISSGSYLPVNALALNGSDFLAGTVDHANSTYGGVYHTSNTGTTWYQYTGLSGGSWVTSLAVANGVFYAGTYGGGLYFSPDNGTTWNQASSVFGIVSSVAGSGNEAVVVGPDPSFISFSSNSGKSWTSTASLDIMGDSPATIFVSGGYIFIGTGLNGVFRSPLP